MKIVCEITKYIVHCFSIGYITTLSFENKISIFMGSIRRHESGRWLYMWDKGLAVIVTGYIAV